MPLHFRTISSPITQRINPLYLEEVSRNAYALWVHVPGLCQFDRPPRRPRAVIEYEYAAKRWAAEIDPVAKRRPTAYLILMTSNVVAGRLCGRHGHWVRHRAHSARQRGQITTWSCLEWWREGDKIVPRLQKALGLLRATGARLFLHAEDFSARWCVMAGIKPAGWLLDNPVLTRDDVHEHAAILDAPGWIRQCHWPLRSRLAYFGAPTNLVRGNVVDERSPVPSQSREAGPVDLHGVWTGRHWTQSGWPRGQKLESIADFILKGG